jgi:hypothetical protein
LGSEPFRCGLEPAEEGHDLLDDEADGTVVADGDVFEAGVFLVRDRCAGFPQVVAATELLPDPYTPVSRTASALGSVTSQG